MLKIETYPLGPLQTNAYLLIDQSRERAVVIDPGMQPEKLLARIESLEVEAILLTHAHFDHIGGVDVIRKRTRCPVYLHEAEAEWLTHPEFNGSLLWPDLGGPIQSDPPDYALEDKGTLQLLGETFAVMHTPGHSPGSVSFLYGDCLFGGDVLFRLSVGRTDLPGGSQRELYASIHDKLFTLDRTVMVYPGHGPATTIGYEQDNNPYV